MQLFFILLDPSALGRLDYTTMSQQALMECLIAHFNEDTLQHFRDENKNFRDVSDWYGVECNSEGDVFKIHWDNFGQKKMGGSIDLQWLPPTVQEISIQSFSFGQPLLLAFGLHVLPRSLRNLHVHSRQTPTSHRMVISGSFSDLPESIEKVHMVSCIFSMPLCLIGIPKSVQQINIVLHEFGHLDLRCDSLGLTKILITQGAKQGTVSFIDSPPALVTLKLRENKLIGSLSFLGLSPCLDTLSLEDNFFHGVIVFENIPISLQLLRLDYAKFEKMGFNAPLPEGLKHLYASMSATSGTINFLHFAEATETIWVNENQLSGSVRFDHLVNIVHLNASKNLLEGSLDLRSLSNKLDLLNLSRNRLTGTVDFSALPPELSRLHLQNNRLSGSFVIASLPPKLHTLDLANNDFVMEALVVAIGAKLPQIDLRGNRVQMVANTRGKKLQARKVKL